ncbi:PEP-CTERM sorting domain-containing protein [Coraliomargarita sp. W4R72]
MKIYNLLIIPVLATALSAQDFSDDFTRDFDVSLTETGTQIGSDYVIKSGTYGISDSMGAGTLFTDEISSPTNRFIFNTSVTWADSMGESSSQSVVLRTSETGVWAGIVLNVQDADNDDYYLFRFNTGSGKYQFLRRDDGSSSTLISKTDAISNFAANTDYEMTVTQTFGGDYAFTITEFGSTTVLNPSTTAFDDTYTGGYSGIYFNGVGTEASAFNVGTIPEPGAYALLLGVVSFASILVRRRRV